MGCEQRTESGDRVFKMARKKMNISRLADPQPVRLGSALPSPSHVFG